jgi:hypothetical protein
LVRLVANLEGRGDTIGGLRLAHNGRVWMVEKMVCCEMLWSFVVKFK